MPPARRRKLDSRRKRDKKGFRVPKFFILLLVSFTFFLFLAFQTSFWKGDSKLALVIKAKKGDVLVSVFDSKLEQITRVTIPKDTQVEVARQLGTWRVGSVWQLGENEGLKGKLLAETVTYYFKFPVVAWADSPAEGFASGQFLALIKAVILPYKTNLKLGDRVKLAFFSFRVKNFKREDIDLGESAFLKRKRLVDGGVGYVLVGSLPPKLVALFTDPVFSEKNTRVIIKDATGKAGVAEKAGEIVEALGAKVIAITKQESEKFDCFVLGKDRQSSEKLSQVFSCQKVKEVPSGSLDLELRIGEEFARRL